MVGKEAMDKHATNDASKTPMSFITRNFGTLSWERLRALERKNECGSTSAWRHPLYWTRSCLSNTIISFDGSMRFHGTTSDLLVPFMFSNRCSNGSLHHLSSTSGLLAHQLYSSSFRMPYPSSIGLLQSQTIVFVCCIVLGSMRQCCV